MVADFYMGTRTPDNMRLKKLVFKKMASFFGLALFGAAAVALYRQLHAYRLHDILFWIRAIPARQTWTAVLLTTGSYLIMTGYDLLALRYIRHPLPLGRTALTSFLGYTFSNSIGLSMVAGASVRYRLYSAWGLSAAEITQVVLFCTASLWLGFCALSGAIFVTEPMALPHSLLWPVHTVRPLGLLLLALVGFYFAATLAGRKALTLKGWRLAPPSWRLAGAQTVIASADWLMAGSVLYVLLPQGTALGYSHFLEIYLIAQLAGLVSQVPGGLGVFETVILLLLPAGATAPRMLGALVVYRGVYYLLPLMVAVLALGIEELLRRRSLVTRLQSLAGSAMEALFIPLISLAVFLAGAVLMFSGALPPIPQRLASLKNFLPLPFLELSHFLGSLAGMGLLLLARSLQRRFDAAWLLTAALLSLGIAASLLKGVDFVEASFLALVLVVLLPSRRLFFRRASLFSEPFTPGWQTAIAMVLISSIGLGLFAFRHVEYSHDLWWQFSFNAGAPRFLRATVGALVLALGFGLARLLRPAAYRPRQPVDTWPEEIPAIVRHSPAASANLAMLGDKLFLLSEKRQAFIMYGMSGQTWVAMGDPVGAVEQWPDLLRQFRRLADYHGGRAVWYEVSHENLHFYLDMGLTLLKLGEEARVPLTVELVPAASVQARMSELQAISDAWLNERNTREKGFSLGYFEPEYIRRFPMGLVRFQNKIVAFANIWSGAGRSEITVDLMRHRPDAPNSAMDFLIIELMLWGQTQGYEWFNLGMAPLSGMETHESAPLWHRIGGLVVRFGDHFYNFQGLRAYKEKFGPVWHSRYLAAPGGLSLPRTLADTGALISGGVKGIVFK
jgi:phosphatidylglycerol lysyltransferase